MLHLLMVSTVSEWYQKDPVLVPTDVQDKLIKEFEANQKDED